MKNNKDIVIPNPKSFLLEKVRISEKTIKTKKEKQISKIIDNNISVTVARYLRKNPHQVFKNFKNGDSIFGPYDVSPRIFEKTEENLNTIINSFKRLYTNNQLENYEN